MLEKIKNEIEIYRIMYPKQFKNIATAIAIFGLLFLVWVLIPNSSDKSEVVESSSVVIVLDDMDIVLIHRVLMEQGDSTNVPNEDVIRFINTQIKHRRSDIIQSFIYDYKIKQGKIVRRKL
jgi:hypothetical protein